MADPGVAGGPGAGVSDPDGAGVHRHPSHSADPLETQGDQVRRVLCFKGKTGSDGLAREEIETDVAPELFQRLERFIGRPLIQKEQRRYALADGLVLEVNQVDPGHPGAFFYAEVEFPDLETARSWRPGPLAAYLDQEVTGTPGESMAAYWERTRGMT